jgi:hypothetical protein
MKTIVKKVEDAIGSYFKPALIEMGIREEDVPKAIADIGRYYGGRLSEFLVLDRGILKDVAEDKETGMEVMRELYSDRMNVLVEIVKGYRRYANYKEEIEKTYQESKDWYKVFSTGVYSDSFEAQESFIDYVEETYQTKIKDAKHLQTLTGITHLDSWDSKAGKYITPDTEEEAKENAIRELEDTLTSSRYNKYLRALQTAIQGGAKYKDLLQIKPQEYGLPKSWRGNLGTDQYSTILWAISFEFYIDEPIGLIMLPSLRYIAEEMEAPYSVIMDCYKLFHK